MWVQQRGPMGCSIEKYSLLEINVFVSLEQTFTESLKTARAQHI